MTTDLDGTTDYAECSGQGLCNRRTGTCKCFMGHGSSDGTRKNGKRDDCGFRVGYDPFSERGGEYNSWENHLRGEYRCVSVCARAV